VPSAVLDILHALKYSAFATVLAMPPFEGYPVSDQTSFQGAVPMPKELGPSGRRIVRERTLPGLLLFNPQGKLLSLNPAAREILHQGRQRPLLQPIRSVLRKLNKTLIKTKPSLSSPVDHRLQAIFSSGCRSYSLRVCLFDGRSARRPRTVAVLLERINPNRFDLRKAQRLFRLSPQETEVIRALQRDMTDKEIASVLGVGSKTVRRHLKNIRAKLGVSSHSAMINRLLTILWTMLFIYREIFWPWSDYLIRGD
jgi:DNA-binding CsgD family transcriptional regulator